VKRTILIVAGIAALGTAAYFGTQLAAQTTGGAPAANAGTRVAVVNVGTVFAKYEKAQEFKIQLQKLVEPYKTKAEGWRKEMIQYDEAIKRGDNKVDGKAYAKEALEKAILERKRALEDMDREVRNLIGTKQEQQLVQLWKEINEGIRTYGQQRGFHMVFGYGDPIEAKDLETFANINRKMQGMDLGAVCPLYVANGLDISDEVVASLNARHKQSNPAPITPASGAPK
jgi:Skp family chaperone for outer membrane proteins